jgi:hypothetical protein
MSKDPYFGFGSFSVKVREGRVGRNAKTGTMSMYLKEDAYLKTEPRDAHILNFAVPMVEP